MKSGFTTIRDLATYALGVGLIVFEAVGPGPSDTGLIFLGGALLGLPAFLPTAP